MNKVGQALVRHVAVWSVTVVAVGLLHPVAAAAQAPVAVAVVTKTAQFEDQAQKDRLDTVADLKKLLAKKKTVRLVETTNDAAVVVEVVSRGEETSANSTGQVVPGTRTVEHQAYKDKVVHVKLVVGDYPTEIEGRYADGPNVIVTTCAGAAVDATDKIDKWIKANRAKLP